MITYELADFAGIPVVHAEKVTSATLDDVEAVSAFGGDVKWDSDLMELWDTEKPADRSTALMEAAYLAAELGWEDGQILSLVTALDDRWGKYTGRRDREKLLLDILERARVKVTSAVDGAAPAGFLEQHNTAAIDETEVLGFTDFTTRNYPIEWILEDLLSEGGLGLMTGWPGAGKTTLSLQMAAELALGKQFLRWKSTGPVKVLYLSLEMAAPPLHLFVSKAKDDYTSDELRMLNKNFLIAPFGVPMHLDQEESFKRLDQLLERHQPNVVFVDSLHMLTSKDLTDEEAIKILMDGLAVTRQEHNTAFIIIHHNRKKAADAQRSKGVELSDIYGSTYITAKVDFAVNVTKLDEPNTVRFDTLKNRLGPEPEPFDLIRKEMRFSDPSALTGFFANTE